MTLPTRPVLRYHGGKWRLAAWIIRHFPPHRIYTEAFGGAASVLMQKPRAYAEVYNDRWDAVVNVFRVLRDPARAAELEHRLRLTPYARTEFEQSGIGDVDLTDPVEAARRTILRSFAGFGSAAINAKHATGFRANSNRSGTTPAHDWASYPDQITAFTNRLTGIVIENRPAVEVLQQHDSPDTLHYVDPPYVHSTRELRAAKGRAIYAYEMTDAEHRELADVLHRMRGMVVLSGYWSPFYGELYDTWLCIERASFADGARPRTECLWLSPRTTERLVQPSLFVNEVPVSTTPPTRGGACT